MVPGNGLTVGEALSLPRSTGFQFPTRMGESVPARHLAPFNQTLSFVTWREAESLPYNGWAIILDDTIQPNTQLHYLAGGW